MSARMLPRTVRTDVDLPSVAMLLGRFNKMQQCPGRSVQLRVVMYLPGPGSVLRFVFEQFRSLGHQMPEHRDTYGEVRTPNQPGAGVFDCLRNLAQVLEPARGARDRIYTRLRQPLQIARRNLRMGKLDGNIDAPEVLRSDAGAVYVIVFVEAKNHFQALRGSKALDHVAHFSVTDKR